jgi:hypothetical protein
MYINKRIYYIILKYKKPKLQQNTKKRKKERKKERKRKPIIFQHKLATGLKYLIIITRINSTHKKGSCHGVFRNK